MRQAKDNMIGKIFTYLTVISFAEISKSGKRVWNCLCKCGNYTKVPTGDLNSGKVKSCKCYLSENSSKKKHIISNLKFGKLYVLDEYVKFKDRIKWKCLCDCGRYTFVITKDLKSGHTKSCGFCGMHKNGKATSSKAIAIHNIINKGIHNYKTKLGFYVDIAFVMNCHKIAIEYDEWYWHANKLKKDKERMIKLIDDGWKILQIKASGNIPTEEQLFLSLDKLVNTNIVIEVIELEGWGVNKYQK